MSCSLSTLEDLIVNKTEIEYPLKQDCRFGGSCNGLICIVMEDTDIIFLVNPVLSVFKRLPDLGIQKRSGWGDCYTVYGFGFDASVDDYKVVSIFCYEEEVQCYKFKNIASVYSLRTNCWRRIQDCPFGAPCSFETRKQVDGYMNWGVYLNGSCAIASLDLAHETFKKLMQPSYDDDCSGLALGLLNGCLCQLCNYSGRSYDEVWVMKEYGKRESWTKLVTIPYMIIPPNESCFAPVFVSESGEILLNTQRNLFLYNPKENTLRNPVIIDDAVSYFHQAEVYEESCFANSIRST